MFVRRDGSLPTTLFSANKYAPKPTLGNQIPEDAVPKLTRVEVVDTDGALAGLFFTRRPLAECKLKRTPREFEGVFGEWNPAGGSYYDAFGANSWYKAPGLTLGDVVEVNDDG